MLCHMVTHLRFNLRNLKLVNVALLSVSMLFTGVSVAQEDWSMARKLNDQLLFAIPNDLGRPTIHARNLYHISASMYDSWAAYEPSHDTWLLGKTRGSYFCAFSGANIPSDPVAKKAAQEETMAFAVYRIMSHRFQNSPGYPLIQSSINNFMDDNGFDRFNTSQDYVNGGPAELGNYIAAEYIAYGFQDGANEANGYANQYYFAQNDTVFPELPGNPNIINPNSWQYISLTNGVDQAGNPISGAPEFLSPEWGDLVPFAMTEDDKVVKERDGQSWNIYHDPGPPPMLDPEVPSDIENLYKWGFAMVSVWQSHLDPNDTTMWDISPGARGNLGMNYPTEFEDYPDFYNFFGGNDYGEGHPVNPATGEPYEPQIVKRGDYARILAEYWADGPESYTPPGHWYEIVNDVVLDHPDFERKWMGEGEELDDLEYDVKLYFTLGGSLYDAAISAWSIKGYYDYIRPVSAIRYMVDQGQSTDPDLPSYSPAGIPLIPGYIELVEEGDPLAGEMNEHVGKIKLYTWKGPDYIEYENPDVIEPVPVNYAGVGWILGENWWPYQRPTFVSPPFAGYISGHSTYSSTAAQVMEMVTGDPYFPGGMGVFPALQNEFLHFEVGPSETVVLQWATYRDASDQCSLSRIWGGIHPPLDDLHGRWIGMDVGNDAVNYANDLFNADRPVVETFESDQPAYNIDDIGSTLEVNIAFDREMDTAVNPVIDYLEDDPLQNSLSFSAGSWLNDMTYQLSYDLLDGGEKLDNIVIEVSGAADTGGKTQNVHLEVQPFVIDTDRPEVAGVTYNSVLLNDEMAENGQFTMVIEVDEPCNTMVSPEIAFTAAADLSATLVYLAGSSEWLSDTTFSAVFDLVDNEEEIEGIGITINGIQDAAGNTQEPFSADDAFAIDTRNPEIADLLQNQTVLNIQAVGNNALIIDLIFDEMMDTSEEPVVSFEGDNPLAGAMAVNGVSSQWQNSMQYTLALNLLPAENEMDDITTVFNGLKDVAGNAPAIVSFSDLFIIDTKRPSVDALNPSVQIISDSEVGSSGFQVLITYDEPMNTEQLPVVTLDAESPISGSVSFNPFNSEWLDDQTFEARFNVTDLGVEVDQIDVAVGFGEDVAENFQNMYDQIDWISLDTRNPELLAMNASNYLITFATTGDAALTFLMVFDEVMNQEVQPEIQFDSPVNLDNILLLNEEESYWINEVTHLVAYDVANLETSASGVGVTPIAAVDLAGNEVAPVNFSDYLTIDITTVGFDEYSGNLDLTVFPNPVDAGAELSVRLNEALNNVTARLLSSDGKIIYEEEFRRMDAGNHGIAPAPLAAGMYHLQISAEEGVQVFKVIVSK